MEQDAFFKKELKVIQNYFLNIKVFSAVVHHDEVFSPIDEDMKALFLVGKITPHMPITTIPIVYDKKSGTNKSLIQSFGRVGIAIGYFKIICMPPLEKNTGLTGGETIFYQTNNTSGS